MKKIITAAAALMLVLMLIIPLTGCQKKPEATEAAPATDAPTDAPYLPAQIDEPEWTPFEGELQLEDKDYIYAKSDQILYFAIVTKAGGEQELHFLLNDDVAQMLKGQSPNIAYYMTFNGENIGGAVLSEDCKEAIVTQENAKEEITSLATRIRGLYE